VTCRLEGGLRARPGGHRPFIAPRSPSPALRLGPRDRWQEVEGHAITSRRFDPREDPHLPLSTGLQDAQALDTSTVPSFARRLMPQLWLDAHRAPVVNFEP
jgi:hypothetical protein